MTQIVGLLRDVFFGVRAGDGQLPPGDPNKPRHHAEQRGFAGAIAPRHQQGLAAGQGETQSGKDLTAAPDAGEPASLKPHRHSRRPSLRARRPGMSAMQSPQLRAILVYLAEREKSPYKP